MLLFKEIRFPEKFNGRFHWILPRFNHISKLQIALGGYSILAFLCISSFLSTIEICVRTQRYNPRSIWHRIWTPAIPENSLSRSLLQKLMGKELPCLRMTGCNVAHYTAGNFRRTGTVCWFCDFVISLECTWRWRSLGLHDVIAIRKFGLKVVFSESRCVDGTYMFGVEANKTEVSVARS